MARIARDIPELAGKLSAPRVTYVKSSQKTYISFESPELAGERQFLKLERVLRDVFPGRPLAVRVTSPGLKAAFLEDPAPYRQVLDDFLRRNYPMAKAWIGQIRWRIEKNQLGDGTAPVSEHEEDGLLTLVFPDEISLQLMNRNNVGARSGTEPACPPRKATSRRRNRGRLLAGRLIRGRHLIRLQAGTFPSRGRLFMSRQPRESRSSGEASRTGRWRSRN